MDFYIATRGAESMSQGLHIHRQRGVALITALLVVALTTVMAVSLMSQQYMDIRRTGNIMLSDQAYLYDLALESFAGQLLKTYRSNQKYDDLQQIQQAMMLFQSIPVEGGSVSATVEFSEAKFNVNSLINDKGKPDPWAKNYYSRLVGEVLQNLGADASLRDDLVNALLDWLDPDGDTRLGGAEDSAYESRDIPYKAANQMMSSISELRLVQGYSREILDGIPADPQTQTEAVPGLLAYLTALPNRNCMLNVNLIQDPVMFMAMVDNMNKDMVDELIKSQPFEKTGDFMGNQVFNDLKKTQPGNANDKNNINAQLQSLSNHITVQSSYFLLRGMATVGESKLTLNSLLYANNAGTAVSTVYRAIGTSGI